MPSGAAQNMQCRAQQCIKGQVGWATSSFAASPHPVAHRYRDPADQGRRATARRPTREFASNRAQPRHMWHACSQCQQHVKGTRA